MHKSKVVGANPTLILCFTKISVACTPGALGPRKIPGKGLWFQVRKIKCWNSDVMHKSKVVGANPTLILCFTKISVACTPGALGPPEISGKRPVISSWLNKMLEFGPNAKKQSCRGQPHFDFVFYKNFCNMHPGGPRAPGKFQEKACDFKFAK